jgi:hypothetical protein
MTKFLRAALLLALLSLPASRPPSAGEACESCMGSKHFLWDMTWCDSYPARASSAAEEAAVRQHYRSAARFLSMSLKVRAGMQADPAVNRQRFKDAILHLTATGQEPFRLDTLQRYVRHPDSLVKSFTSLVPDESASMLTVELGRYPSRKAAEAAATRNFHELTEAWGDVRRLPDGKDTWSLTDCGTLPGWAADLFVLGPQSRRERGWRVLHGLYDTPALAAKGQQQALRVVGSGGKVVPIEVTGTVLRAAREWAEPEFERRRKAAER